jgi:glucosamine-phosphate N-acetyltransferase
MTSIEEEKLIEVLISREDGLSIDNFKFRLIELNDYHKGYFELLNFLTISPKPEYSEWEIQFNKINNKSTFIFVIEDISKNLIIGNITCLIEYKFIRNLGRVSHIEDVVINSDYRNNKFGTKLINFAINFSKEMKCYKVILDSKEEAVGFYNKFGFQKKSEGMALYF